MARPTETAHQKGAEKFILGDPFGTAFENAIAEPLAFAAAHAEKSQAGC
jgi:hypothetical protein